MGAGKNGVADWIPLVLFNPGFLCIYIFGGGRRMHEPDSNRSLLETCKCSRLSLANAFCPMSPLIVELRRIRLA